MDDDVRKPVLSSTTTTGQIRQRSSIACRTCNARRVKCDASNKLLEGLPCSNCAAAKSECRLIESRRGRKPKAARRAYQAASAYSITSPTPNGSPGVQQAAINGSGKERDQSMVMEEEHGRPQRQGTSEGPETLYAAMLESTADHGKRRQLLRPGGRVVYLGETFNLTYLLQQTNAVPHQHADKRHFLLPVDPKQDSTKQCTAEDSQTAALLTQQDAFLVLPSEICHELFRVYFSCVHPHYPILDRQDFATRYYDAINPPSYLLLQAVCFMAAGHLQSLFLMSFHWTRPTDQKDTWHWLGATISLALTLGIRVVTKQDKTSRGVLLRLLASQRDVS
ncbi:hypothetical protein BJ546DRAFT_704031 [Cryomyces antarcticus]